MKTKRINGQKFARISYTNFGSHSPVQTWYPVQSLRWLSHRCDFSFVR